MTPPRSLPPNVDGMNGDIAEARARMSLTPAEVATALSAMTDRVLAVLEEVGLERFPVYREHGAESWTATSEWHWASGHWIGLLWLAARQRPPPLRNHLEDVATSLSLRIAASERTDNIFYGLTARLGGFDGFDQTGDPRLHAFGISGARAMAQLFDERAQQIPIGRHETIGIDPKARERDGKQFDPRFVAAVDVIHTSVPVLWRAWRETGDRRFWDIASAHCERHLQWHTRRDGGVDQKTAFSPNDGQPIRTFSPLAATDQGCWSRGLAWHVAGSLEAHEATGDRRFLEAADRSLTFLRLHSEEHVIPRFDCLATEGPLDTSAAAVVGWGVSQPGRSFASIRNSIVSSLVRHHLDDSGALLNGCYSVSSGVATDAELIWGSYYLARTLELLAEHV